VSFARNILNVPQKSKCQPIENRLITIAAPLIALTTLRAIRRIMANNILFSYVHVEREVCVYIKLVNDSGLITLQGDLVR
jgi:hypothetical protein